MAAVPQQVRHEWYQTDRKVVITLFIKNAESRKCEVDIKTDSVRVTADDLPDVKFNLLHPINQAESTHKFFSVKIELTLIKLNGERWESLERTADNVVTPAPALAEVKPDVKAPIEAPSASGGQPGVVPKNPKDWDKLVKDIWEKEDLEKVSSIALACREARRLLIL